MTFAMATMTARRLGAAALLGLVLAATPAVGGAGLAWATTWARRTVACPICGQPLELLKPASYGSYIYTWPSRLQLLFWPSTDEGAVHFCKHCHVAALLGDFERLRRLDPTKREALRRAVQPLRKPQKDTPYERVPIGYRLELAEAVYQQLGKDDAFWLRFYRLKGYHLARAKDLAGARSARLRALALAEKLLAARSGGVPDKELRVIVAAMRYLTGDKPGALKALDEARRAKVDANEVPMGKAADVDRYLGEVADELDRHVTRGTPLPQ